MLSTNPIQRRRFSPSTLKTDHHSTMGDQRSPFLHILISSSSKPSQIYSLHLANLG
jgi:hypothetical protein